MREDAHPLSVFAEAEREDRRWSGFPSSDRYMTRESVVEELLERLEVDLCRGADYCGGEALVRKLFEDYRMNTTH
jgi:hypothetical protein